MVSNILGSPYDYKGALKIGRYYAIDGSLGSNVFLDFSKPHVILIFGKRGYGKSYTMATIIEELMLADEARNNIGVVIIDTLGIFWTMSFPNKREEERLKKWGINARGFKIEILSSSENVEYYRSNGINAKELVIGLDELNYSHWMQLFGLSVTDPIMAVIGRAISNLGKNYSIDDVIEEIWNGKGSDALKISAENLLTIAKSWNIFGKDGIKIGDIVDKGKTMVIDLSPYEDAIKDVILSIIAEKIFEKSVKERKIREFSKSDFPMVWLAIDEAHLFLSRHPSSAKNVLIKQWMRQGRQPGISLLLAAQQLGSLDPEIFSHADIIISHRLTAKDDIETLNRIRPAYMHEAIGEAITKMGNEKGVAIVIDDVSERVHVIKIRPRMSWHAGNEPDIRKMVKEKDKCVAERA